MWARKSTSVRVGPTDGQMTSPVTTSKLIMNDSLHVAVKKELNPIDVFRSPHQKRAADAEGSSGAPNAQTGVATMAKRDGMQAAVAPQNLTSALVRFDHE